MYERLDKLREDLKRCERRLLDAQNKLKQAQERLKEAENSQIIQDVEQLKLTPEQLAEVLAMARAGQFGMIKESADMKAVGGTENNKDQDPDPDEKDPYEDEEDKEDEDQ